MWDCPKCFEPIEEAFPECWNCGTKRSELGVEPTAADAEPTPDAGLDATLESVVASAELVENISAADGFIFSTTPSLETHSVVEYLGVVAGEGAVTKTGSLEEIAKSFETLFNSDFDLRIPAHSYQLLLNDARQVAMNSMAAQAKKLGANGVVGVSLDYEKLGDYFVMIISSGTAVRLEKK